jgi:hypothetical protein
MTLSVSSPSPGGIGAGMTVSIHSSTIGPLAVTDFWQAAVVPPGVSNVVCVGAVKANGSHDNAVVLGLATVLYPVPSNVVSAALADGASCDLQLIRYNSAGDSVEFGTSTGWSYRPASALWNLVNDPASINAQLAQLLAAVTHTYRNAP